MKKTLTILVCLLACASLAACGEKKETETTTAAETTAAEETVEETSAEETTAAEETAEETTAAEDAAADETAEAVAAADTEASEFAEFEGFQYAAADPWEGEISVTIRSVSGNDIEWTYTDVISDNTCYAELNSTLEDGKAEFTAEGKVNNEDSANFSYSGTIELKNGQIIITLTDGAIKSNSEEGGGASYQVGPLEDAARTITLDKHELNGGV